MTNKDIKTLIEKSGFPLWRVADEIGVCDMTLYRWLRSERDTKKQPKIIAALERLKREAAISD